MINPGKTADNREVRIFLSSTFSDMQEERNYLTKRMNPGQGKS